MGSLTHTHTPLGIDDPIEASGDSGAVSEEQINLLCGMGFSAQQAKKALKETVCSLYWYMIFILTPLLCRIMILNEPSIGCLAILTKQAKKRILQLQLLQALLAITTLLSTTLYDHLYHTKALRYIVVIMSLTCSRTVNGCYSTTTKWPYHQNHQWERPTCISCNARDEAMGTI